MNECIINCNWKISPNLLFGGIFNRKLTKTYVWSEQNAYLPILKRLPTFLSRLYSGCHILWLQQQQQATALTGCRKFLFCGFNGSVKTTFSKIWDDRKSKIFIFVEIYFSQLGKVGTIRGKIIQWPIL